MSSRKEADRKYFKTHKEEIAQRRKQRTQDLKLQSLKNELDNLKSVFDISTNPFVDKINVDKTFSRNLKRYFELIFDIDHFPRQPGDSKQYLKEREEYCRKQQLEWDLKNRIIKWRLFRKAVLTRRNSEPTYTQCHYNNVFEPSEIKPDNKKYRPDLMYLTQIQADDPLIEVILAEDLARQHEEEYARGEHLSDFEVNMSDFEDGY